MAKKTTGPSSTRARKGMPSPRLSETEFRRRYLARFADPAFAPLKDELAAIATAAWDAYADSRKSPHTVKAGRGFADPDYDLSTDWLAARAAITEAQRRHDDRKRPLRILLVNGSPRSEHTCPGEMSKTWRMVELAQRALTGSGIGVEVLDLSRLTSEYGRNIHPCKACFSTSPALCHWPCSCYPNHSLGQVQDWMNDIYPMWVAAHGIMIVTPVHWYQATSPLKLMIDRLVCADGGNPDPTSTEGKKAELAKKLELKGWLYPRHLAGRLFAVVVHGDAEGADGLRRSLVDWLRSMELRPAGDQAELGRYVGYWEPYATSHQALDRDKALQDEVRNAALALAGALRLDRKGKLTQPQRRPAPRQK
jgi:multimeric flavodoxin WrbA